MGDSDSDGAPLEVSFAEAKAQAQERAGGGPARAGKKRRQKKRKEERQEEEVEEQLLQEDFLEELGDWDEAQQQGPEEDDDDEEEDEAVRAASVGLSVTELRARARAARRKPHQHRTFDRLDMAVSVARSVERDPSLLEGSVPAHLQRNGCGRLTRACRQGARLRRIPTTTFVSRKSSSRSAKKGAAPALVFAQQRRLQGKKGGGTTAH